MLTKPAGEVNAQSSKDRGGCAIILPMVPSFGKMLMFVGGLLLIVGLVLVVAGRIPWAGRLPGDWMVQKGRFTLYFPLTSCLLVSALISLVMHFFRK